MIDRSLNLRIWRIPRACVHAALLGAHALAPKSGRHDPSARALFDLSLFSFFFFFFFSSFSLSFTLTGARRILDSLISLLLLFLDGCGTRNDHTFRMVSSKRGTWTWTAVAGSVSAVRATLPLAAGWREEKTAEGQT